MRNSDGGYSREILEIYEKNVEKISDELKEKGVNIPLLKDYYYNDAPSEKNSVFVVNYSGIKKEDISKIVKILEEVI